VSVRGYVYLVVGEPDGDYHIQISNSPTSGDNCIVVEVPKDDPIYVKDPYVREKAGAVRQLIRDKLLQQKEPSSTGSVLQHAPYIEFTGGLFFDDAHVGDAPTRGKGHACGHASGDSPGDRGAVRQTLNPAGYFPLAKHELRCAFRKSVGIS